MRHIRTEVGAVILATRKSLMTLEMEVSLHDSGIGEGFT